MGVRKCVLVALVLGTAPVGVVAAAPASADCTNAGAATVCAQGEVRGGGPTAPVAGPVYPSYCADPWYCDDGWSFDLSPSWPSRPGGPGGGIGGGGGLGGGGGGGIGPR